jgi:3-hydroxyisobutyrate dehydrogenase-like beta-hydroxyacid dehydrogenase
MASTISRAGHPVVLWNRRRDKAERVAEALGCPVFDSPAEAATAAEVVITSLADDAAVREVYLGDGGVVAGVRSGTVVVDTSTVSPDTVIEVGHAVDRAGGRFLDCPVSGSVSVVEAGNLTIMAGGDPEVLEEARAVLEAMASRIVHTGVRGTGAATKLAVNALVHGLNIALSEALVLAERAGVDRKVAYEVFANGAGGAPFVQYKRDAYEHPDDTPVAFSLDLVQKDLELITGLATAVGAPMVQASTGLDLVRAANRAGYADRDLSALAEYMRGEAG